MENERWAPVAGFEQMYEVSDYGRVRSLKTVAIFFFGKHSRVREGRVLKAALDGDGYPKVALGRAHQRKVHVLVARAFIPNPEGLPEVDHEDTNKMNCHYLNLRWCTRRQNSMYRDAKSYKTCEAKFSAAQKSEIIKAIHSGEPALHVSRRLKVSRAHARRLAQLWRARHARHNPPHPAATGPSAMRHPS